MSSIRRRQFLQFVGASALTTLGLDNIDFPQQGKRYSQVLAQTKPRKLALLVGINSYLNRERFSPLQGCVTDLELQRQLLIHRYGFNPKDILTLTNTQATRQGILTAFEEHLIKQTQPGDVVVFHFSGHGSQLIDPDGDVPDRLISSLVPADSSLQPDGSVPAITEDTLWLLMAALNTENITVVLDASHSGGFTTCCLPSSIIFTSKFFGNIIPQVSPEEKAYQRQWLTRLDLSSSEFIEQQKAGIAKGILMASTQREQLAADAVLGDVYAGAFTYCMTQYLWQQTGNEPARSAIANIIRGVTRLSFTAQKPEFAVKPNSDNENRPIYFIERQTPSAEAVITKVEGDRLKLWLGGIEPQSLEAFTQGAILTIVDNTGKEQGQVQLISRQGIVGTGKVLEAAPNAVQPGALLQERIRGIPGNVTLRLGLDPSLSDDITRTQQALQAIKRIEVLPLEQGADYILGCMTATYQQKLQQSQKSALPPIGSIGLFRPGLVLIPDSFGAAGESVTAAIDRLHPKLKSLLATRIVQLALNTNASRLNVAAWMTREKNPQQVIAQAFALRGSGQRSTATQRVERNTNLPEQAIPVDAVRTSGVRPALPTKTDVQLYVVNNERRELYSSILVIDSTREISVLFPNQWAAAQDVTRVKAGETLLIPDPSKDSFRLVTQEPKGVVEVLIIASSKPLRKTLLSLRAIASRGGQRGGPITLKAPDDPTDIIDSLLNDLNVGDRTKEYDSILRRSTSIAVSDNPDIRSLDTTQLAVMSMQIEVI